MRGKRQVGIDWRLHRGSAAAQFNLGLMYARGQGVAQDLVTGMLWVSLAARQGHPDAQTVRDRLCGHLTPEQHEQVQALLPLYAASYSGGVR